MSRPVPDHGTRARYLRGCHCPDCLVAHRQYVKRYRHTVGYQGSRSGPPLRPMRVPVGPVADHLAALVASGWTLTAAAAEAGTDSGRLSRIARRQQSGIHRDLALAILAVEPLPEARDIVDPVVVERLCADPMAWRHGLPTTRAERLAAAHILGSWSHKALGYSGSDAKRGAA